MEKEIEIKLNAIEQYIAKHKAECRRNVYETLNNILKDYPSHTDEIQAKFQDVCRKHRVDFYAEMCVSGNDIAQYVEQNVKTIEQ